VSVVVRPLDPARDAPACDAVLATLPHHFGDEDGRRQCAEAVRTQRGWVAVEGDGKVVGFVTVEPLLGGAAVEVTWLAVRDDRRRHGIGKRLLDAAVDAARATGTARSVCVLTLGPSVPEPGVTDGYEGTRRFYVREGFLPVKEVGLREWNSGSALVLVRPL
jgi:GNAT superfamily N-acetyltransferase